MGLDVTKNLNKLNISLNCLLKNELSSKSYQHKWGIGGGYLFGPRKVLCPMLNVKNRKQLSKIGPPCSTMVTSIWFFQRFFDFCEQKSDSLVKKSKLLPSLFCHEQPERIAHGCYFVQSDLSDLLMVAL